MKRKKFWGIFISTVVLAGFLATLGLAAYSSHQNDEDVKNFLTVYPFAQFTKLDDCSLCHPGGKLRDRRPTAVVIICHITYGLKPPHGAVPLNAYGQAYKDAGRNAEAIRSDRVVGLGWGQLHQPGRDSNPFLSLGQGRLPGFEKGSGSSHEPGKDPEASRPQPAALSQCI